MRYEREGYDQDEHSDEGINANFVCSWTLTETRAGPEIEIASSRWGTWHITPASCPGGYARFPLFVQRLRDVSSGRSS